MDAFGARQAALEGSYYRQEELRQLTQRAEKLRSQGKLPSSLSTLSGAEAAPASASLSLYDIPTSFAAKKACEVPYAHTPTRFPAPRTSSAEQWGRLGTQVSFGRGRWDADGTSIFAVNEGKQMAQEPQRLPTAFEAKRMAKIERAAVESPLLQGYRLLPQFTPGRAFMWGSILAMWGTAGLALSVSRSLDIHTAEEASDKLRDAFEPVRSLVRGSFVPLREYLPSMRTPEQLAQENSLSELARRMKVKLQAS